MKYVQLFVQQFQRELENAWEHKFLVAFWYAVGVGLYFLLQQAF